jgi:hypothetical protein
MNRPPPGFENILPQQPRAHLSTFVDPDQMSEGRQRGYSPPNDVKRPQLAQRKPISKRSCQNVIPPLVGQSDIQIDMYLDKYLKDKNGSDSLSDDNDQDYIKEEDSDDSAEEEKVTTVSTKKGRKKSSNELNCKLLFSSTVISNVINNPKPVLLKELSTKIFMKSSYL